MNFCLIFIKILQNIPNRVAEINFSSWLTRDVCDIEDIINVVLKSGINRGCVDTHKERSNRLRIP